MLCLRKIIVALLILVFICGCKRKKVSLSGNDPVEVSDFIESFSPVKLPYQFTDSIVNKKEKDSLLISYQVFTRFVPDTLLTKVFGKIKPKIYPMARVDVDKNETYLFVKAMQGEKKAAFILGFDKDDQFVCGMPLMQPDQSTATQQASGIDKKYSIYKTLQRRNADGNISEGKDVYVFNADARQFTLIMTDALDESNTELINPIDTLQKKNKYSGDYIKDKKNIISIRDGRHPGRFPFFISIEKKDAGCTGELKGEAQFTSANTAVYRQGGDPCVLKFTFTSTAVSIKEVEGCGARRGLNCSFNGFFPRKKEHKPIVSRKKNAAKK